MPKKYYPAALTAWGISSLLKESAFFPRLFGTILEQGSKFIGEGVANTTTFITTDNTAFLTADAGNGIAFVANSTGHGIGNLAAAAGNGVGNVLEGAGEWMEKNPALTTFAAGALFLGGSYRLYMELINKRNNPSAKTTLIPPSSKNTPSSSPKRL